MKSKSRIRFSAATTTMIPLTTIQGPATDVSSAVRTCAHTHAAGRTTKNNRNAVRFTVPSTVIAGAVGSRRRSANVFAFRAGFEVRIKAMAPLSLEWVLQLNLVLDVPSDAQLHPLRLRM